MEMQVEKPYDFAKNLEIEWRPGCVMRFLWFVKICIITPLAWLESTSLPVETEKRISVQ